MTEVERRRAGPNATAADAQHALAASELRYRRLFESAKDGIFILDAESGKIVDVNPFLVALIGYSRADLLERCLWEIGVFKDVAASKEAFAELQTQDYVRYEHLPLETRDGRKIAVEFVSNVYLVDGGRVVQCNVRDITARKQAEDDLMLRDHAIEAISLGIVITDPTLPDNPLTYVSPGFTRLTGYASAEALGRNCRFLGGRDTDPEFTRKLADAIAARQPCRVELVNYRRDGTSFWNEVSITPVVDAAGQLTHFVGVQTDVTERRDLAAQFLQSQKMEAIGQLAGGVAHDFNNLLSVILSYAEIVADDLAPDATMLGDVIEIRTAALRATDLTRQLLAFSRRQVLAPKVLDLHRIVVGMQKLLRRLLGESVTLNLLPALELWRVKADPGQVEQIVMNLAVNARDAMPRGGELTIETANVVLDANYARTHHEVTPGAYVMLAVTDTGCGMDATTKARMFEPFFTTKEQDKGTGLGLATVFGIVKQSGGHIWVYSEPGLGTVFKIYFPQVFGVAEEAAIEPVTELARATETILLVEDDEQVREIAVNILRRCGYIVLVACNGGEALMICETHGAQIDLLLTDVVLPRMSGRQIVARLGPMRPDMKILFMSGYTGDAVRQHGVLEGGVAFLGKPFTPGSLTRKVREVLRAAARETHAPPI
jgi:PAS domain S-box-containing protein